MYKLLIHHFLHACWLYCWLKTEYQRADGYLSNVMEVHNRSDSFTHRVYKNDNRSHRLPLRWRLVSVTMCVEAKFKIKFEQSPVGGVRGFISAQWVERHSARVSASGAWPHGKVLQELRRHVSCLPVTFKIVCRYSTLLWSSFLFEDAFTSGQHGPDQRQFKCSVKWEEGQMVRQNVAQSSLRHNW